MRILAIETSCDETAVAVLEAQGDAEHASFKILGNALYSQVAVHAPYGGVYPALAKREHQANLAPLTREALKQAGLLQDEKNNVEDSAVKEIREEDFKKSTKEFLNETARPPIDLIAVTRGPGLEPALWTGITFAQTLATQWNIPIAGIDHMEGHIVSALLKEKNKNEFSISAFQFPMLALLISGGHTEFVLMREWFSYEHVGQTRDDAVGEAFDKVARLLDLSYPGGPKIAELAERARTRLSAQAGGGNPITFPRPMANDETCDVSFSGLKTAVLYKLKSMEKMSETDKEHIAEAFENAVRDVMVIKTKRALHTTSAKTFVVGGGVSANEEIRGALTGVVQRNFPAVGIHFPASALTGDNAIMIGAAGYMRSVTGKTSGDALEASGGLRRE